MTRRYLPGSNVVANRIDGKQSNITRTSNMFNNLFPLYFFYDTTRKKTLLNISVLFVVICTAILSFVFSASCASSSCFSCCRLFFLSRMVVVFLPSFNTLACTHSQYKGKAHIVQVLRSVRCYFFNFFYYDFVFLLFFILFLLYRRFW